MDSDIRWMDFDIDPISQIGNFQMVVAAFFGGAVQRPNG